MGYKFCSIMISNSMCPRDKINTLSAQVGHDGHCAELLVSSSLTKSFLTDIVVVST